MCQINPLNVVYLIQKIIEQKHKTISEINIFEQHLADEMIGKV